MFYHKKTPLIIILTCLSSVTTIQAETVVLEGADLFGGPVTPAIVNIDMDTIQSTSKWKIGDPIIEKPLINRKPRGLQLQTSSERGFGVDVLAQRQEIYNNNVFGNDPEFGNTIINRDGEGYTGVSPADTNGDIGINLLCTIN